MVIPYSSGAISQPQATFFGATFSVTTGSTIALKDVTVPFRVNTTGIPDGTTLYWTNSGTSTSSDFIDNLNSGSFTVTNNTATINRTLINNVSVEGKTIILNVRTNSVSGSIVATSPLVNIIAPGPSPTYSITANTYSTQPGTIVNFTINTTNVPNGTPLYLTYGGTTSSTLVVKTDNFTISSNTNDSPAYVQFSTSATAGQTLEVSVRTGSASGMVVATLSPVITISITPAVASNMVSSLFPTYEGVWYDPNDLSTVFADYNGTPASIGGPVRLLLDKSKGLALGPERLLNGNFASTNNWIKGSPTLTSGTITVQDNKLLIDYPASSGQSYYAYQSLSANNLSLECSKVYKLTGTISDYVRGGISFSVFNEIKDISIWGCPKGVSGGLKNNGNFTCYIVTPKTAVEPNILLSQQPKLNYFQIVLEGGAKLSLSNLSLKEISGNHAFSLPWYKFYTGTDYPPKLSARVNLLTSTDTWTVGVKQTINIGSNLKYNNFVDSNTVTKGRQPFKLYFSGGGTVKVTFTGAGPTYYTQGTNTINAPSNVTQIEVECTSGTVNNIDLRYGVFGSQLPSYQQVISNTNYTTTGFPYYLQFGTDYVEPTQSTPGFLATNQKIFTTSPNKLTIWAGITSTLNQHQGQPFTFPSLYDYPNYWPWSGGRTFLATTYSNVGSAEFALCFAILGYLPPPGDSGAGWPQLSKFIDTNTPNLNFKFPYTQVWQYTSNWLEKSTNCLTIKINGYTPNINSVGGSGSNLANLQGPIKLENLLFLGAYQIGPNGVPGAVYTDRSIIDTTFQGKLYSLVIIGGQATSTQINDVGTYISNIMGGNFWTNSP